MLCGNISRPTLVNLALKAVTDGKRIIVTTDKVKGSLRQEVNEMGYPSFSIPDDVGGRYSIMTAAHLLPLAFNINIDKLIEGYYKGLEYFDDAYNYAKDLNTSLTALLFPL